jgi:hypothetical protein
MYNKTNKNILKKKENVMKAKNILILSIVALLVAAFPTSALASSAGLGSERLSTSLASSTSISSSSYSPQPGDVKLTRDTVFMDMAKSHLIVASGQPVKVDAVLTGSLPDPCHVLRIVVGATTATNVINIQVYSLFQKGVACITVLKPFSVTLPLGSFTSGQYTVFVNGLKLGTFSASPATTSSVTK